jgi:large conductance mechanosensitive channel
VALDGKTYKTLDEAVKAGAPLLKYGLFINTVVDFLVVAAVIFFVINKVAAMAVKKTVEGEAAPSCKICPECASEVPLAARKCRYCGSPV